MKVFTDTWSVTILSGVNAPETKNSATTTRPTATIAEISRNLEVYKSLDIPVQSYWAVM